MARAFAQFSSMQPASVTSSACTLGAASSDQDDKPWRRSMNCPSASAPAWGEIRNSNIEPRNKFESPKPEIQNEPSWPGCFCHWDFVFEICFGLGASCFGFLLRMGASEISVFQISISADFSQPQSIILPPAIPTTEEPTQVSIGAAIPSRRKAPDVFR